MTTFYCNCDAFALWYTTSLGEAVCVCGHFQDEHLDGERSCLGESVLLPASPRPEEAR